MLEDALEAYAILAAMGPTCFWFQWQTMRELAAAFGLVPADPHLEPRAPVLPIDDEVA